MCLLYKQYKEYFPLTKEEKKLLFCLLCIPPKIEFSKYTYQNTVIIQKELEKLDKTFQLFSKENEENQEANQEKFKEQNNNIDFSRNKD